MVFLRTEQPYRSVPLPKIEISVCSAQNALCGVHHTEHIDVGESQFTPPDHGLTEELLQNLVTYANASWIERHCCYVIAASTDPSDLRQFSGAFAEICGNGDSKIRHPDFRRAMQRAYALFVIPPDIDAIFKGTDLDKDGTIDFVEFATACLYAQLGPMDGWLAEQAFNALDRDEDGFVSPQDVIVAFGALPHGLPMNRPFVLREWTPCVLRAADQRSDAVSSSRVPAGGAAPEAVKCVEPRQPRSLLESDLFDMFFGKCASKEEEAFNLEFHDLRSPIAGVPVARRAVPFDEPSPLSSPTYVPRPGRGRLNTW